MNMDFARLVCLGGRSELFLVLLAIGMTSRLLLGDVQRLSCLRQDGYIVFEVPPGESVAEAHGLCLDRQRSTPSQGASFQPEARILDAESPVARIIRAATDFSGSPQRWRESLSRRLGVEPASLPSSMLGEQSIFRVAQTAVWHFTNGATLPLDSPGIGAALEVLFTQAGLPVPFSQTAELLLATIMASSRRVLEQSRDPSLRLAAYKNYLCAYRLTGLATFFPESGALLASFLEERDKSGLSQFIAAFRDLDEVTLSDPVGAACVSSLLKPSGASYQGLEVKIYARPKSDGVIAMMLPVKVANRGLWCYQLVMRADPNQRMMNRLPFLGRDEDQWRELSRELEMQNLEDLLAAFSAFAFSPKTSVGPPTASIGILGTVAGRSCLSSLFLLDGQGQLKAETYLRADAVPVSTELLMDCLAASKPNETVRYVHGKHVWLIYCMMPGTTRRGYILGAVLPENLSR